MSDLARHVTSAADAVTQANHATFRGLIAPPDAYDVVGGLVDLARRLPQLTDFLIRSITRADPADYFDDRDSDGEPDTKLTLTVALAGLFGAGHDLTELAFHLEQTHNALGHLGRHTPED
ncbi:hypothetical protein [Actinomycetospora flava]|uniref:Uncharacterized protein n=1 Tax=Actinomycetospora flava TaxID=3129232 RepID=A0ABU8M255_9PSEU